MTEPEKKFTFGFSKIAKKSNLIRPASSIQKPNNVQFIDCIEEKAIKLRDGEGEEEKSPLVIPIIGPRKSSTLATDRSIADIVENFSDLDKPSTKIQSDSFSNIGPAASLDAMAVREILQEASDPKEQENQSLEALPAVTNADREHLQKESTMEDYDNVPVSQFGLAMLRGMGWKPGEGIGRNKQLVPVSAPSVRPKGLGLGADKVALSSISSATKSDKTDEENLKVIKGACVRIVLGSYRGQYALVEGFTDDSGRAVVKLAIGGRSVSIIEASLCPVSKSEYNKNSKVLNADKFEEFKRNEEKDSTKNDPITNIHQPSKPQSPQKSVSVPGGSNTMHDSGQRKFTSVVNHEHKASSRLQVKKEFDSSSESSESREEIRRKVNRSPHRREGRGPVRHRSISRSPRRGKGSCDVSVGGCSKSRDISHDQTRRTQSSDSDNSHNGSHSTKEKKKNRHRRQRHSSTDSGEYSSHRSSRKKKKGKKSRKSHSRSPSNRRRR